VEKAAKGLTTDAGDEVTLAGEEIEMEELCEESKNAPGSPIFFASIGISIFLTLSQGSCKA
jgi:hypothetical protein